MNLVTSLVCYFIFNLFCFINFYIHLFVKCTVYHLFCFIHLYIHLFVKSPNDLKDQKKYLQ